MGKSFLLCALLASGLALTCATSVPTCPPDNGELATLLPHEDCTKFWICNFGEAVEKECEPGLHFNPVLLVCDYPENAGCTGTGKADSDIDSDSGLWYSGVPECSVDNGELQYFLPHEDCTKYWYCDFGEAREGDCPPGLHFNPVLLVCDYPENAGCTGTGRT